MEKRLPGKQYLTSVTRAIRVLGLGLVIGFVASSAARGQTVSVTGKVTNASGQPLRGVSVHVSGSTSRVLTDANGRYTISAPSNGILDFTLLGQRGVQETIAGRSNIDVSMAPIAFLEEMVVTAYGQERRAEITGAVASAHVETIQKESNASVLKSLDVAVPGVTVATSGAPGSRSTVRIRGISSFQNNDPLYIVDGVPVQDSYINFLNPDDVTSVQVLKDASAASIYGSRASNGVIIIETTKKGVAGPPRATLRVRTGVASATKGYDDILITNSLDYFQVLKAAYKNAGRQIPTNIYGDSLNPSIPKYIYAPSGAITATDQFGRPTTVDVSQYSYPTSLIMPGSAGTNWWKQVFHSAPLQDINLDVAGGGDDNVYNVSFNYFNQDGTAIYSYFKRGSVRANTSFNRGKLSFGENAALSIENHTGAQGSGGSLADDFVGENGILGKNIMLQPVIPVRDINGNWAGGKATGLGNSTNPVKIAYEGRDDVARNNRVFGNVFGGLAARPDLNFRSSLGFNIGQGSFSGYNPPSPEVAEATFSNSIDENQNTFMDWTWSNTLKFDRKFLDQHSFSILVGQEANSEWNHFIAGHIGNLLDVDPNSRFIDNSLGSSSTKDVSSSGSKSALLSLFTKADYNFADKYVASFTLRRDGSSRLAPGHQWGTFPAFGIGWRVSKEPFLAGNHVISDLMLRYGYGVTGNQLIPPGRIVTQLGGGTADTYYDIGGGGSSINAGFRQTKIGNPNLRWEEDRSSNVGADAQLFDGAVNVVLDVYRRQTNNLLFDPAIPGTGGVAAPPIVNVGQMRNTGFDLSIGHQTATWSVYLNGGHYKNTILKILQDQTFFYGPVSTRFGNQVINQVGHPIGAFYGYIADGYFQNAADVAAHTPDVNGKCSAYCQPGAAPGRIKFRDVNHDGQLTLADRAIIGSPHPKFTGGLDATYRRGSWDISATVFGSYGNKIFENQMEWYVFREFETNVRKDLLANSWTPSNPNAKYPILDQSDNFSHQLSSFYVKDGSYTRLRNLQIGWNIPPRLNRWTQSSRIYIQGENLFTITKYDGLDPVLPPPSVTGAAGDVRDQYLGVDRGAYPSNRIFSIGLVTSF
jgi:TonB-dependent starch-binding outer membrane protein SusC